MNTKLYKLKSSFKKICHYLLFQNKISNTQLKCKGDLSIKSTVLLLNKMGINLKKKQKNKVN